VVDKVAPERLSDLPELPNLSIGTACVSSFVHPENGRKTPDDGHCPPRQSIFVDNLNGRFVPLFLSIAKATKKNLSFQLHPQSAPPGHFVG
jgi:hypothetical protein